MKRKILLFLLFLLFVTVIVMLFVGRFNDLTPQQAFELLGALLTGMPLSEAQENRYIALMYVRFPRICAAVLVGAGLALSGAVYQSMFSNPLVSPGILGVLAGASFGAGIGIVVFNNSMLATQVLAFLFACSAVGMTLLFSLFFRWRSLLVLLLGGLISASFFTSLTSLMKFIADPDKQLPELTYWLMGSFAYVETDTILFVGVPMLFLIAYLCLQGKVTNALSMGDEEAMSMGVSVHRSRLFIILGATLLSAFTVVMVGIVGWIGLVIPHIMRFFIGPDNRLLLPASAIGGAIFLVVTDAVARSIFTAELPIGVYTSLISLPIFVFSLYINRGNWK